MTSFNRIQFLKDGRCKITHYATETAFGGVEFGDIMFDDEKVDSMEIGAEGVLAIREYPDGKTAAYLEPGDGIPGNMDPTIKRTSGWRGTTNGVATYAHGRRVVEDVRRTRRTVVVYLSAELEEMS